MSSFGVLVVIDVQQRFNDARWGRRDNPGCEPNIATLIADCRRRHRPVVFIRHDSQAPSSPFFSGSPGNAFKPEVEGEPDLLVGTHVNSAFSGSPNLHACLQDHGHRAMTICGITTHHCCETTARIAGNPGYDMTSAIDVTHTLDHQGTNGSWISAEEIAQVKAANPNAEYATAHTTEEILAAPYGHADRAAPVPPTSQRLIETPPTPDPSDSRPPSTCPNQRIGLP